MYPIELHSSAVATDHGAVRMPVETFELNVFLLNQELNPYGRGTPVTVGGTFDFLVDAILWRYGLTRKNLVCSQAVIYKCKEIEFPTTKSNRELAKFLFEKSDPDLDHMDPLQPVAHYFPQAPNMNYFHLIMKIIQLTIPLPLSGPVSAPEPCSMRKYIFQKCFDHLGWQIMTGDDWCAFHERWSLRNFDDYKNKDMIAFVGAEDGEDEDAACEGIGIWPLETKRIYVREDYRRLVKDIVEFYGVESNRSKGIIISGQPGTGKTTLLYYLAACLLMLGQDFLFHQGSDVLLFYQGKVYGRNSSGGVRLPAWRGQHLWSLIDSDLSDTPPPSLAISGHVFPVQASSSDEERYSGWKRQRSGHLLGMPLWTGEELELGIQYDSRYRPFMQTLEDGLKKLKSRNGPPAMGDSMMLKENSSQKPWVQRVILALGKGRTADQLFQKIMNDAIFHFGGTPREVYNAVLEGPAQYMAHIHRGSWPSRS